MFKKYGHFKTRLDEKLEKSNLNTEFINIKYYNNNCYYDLGRWILISNITTTHPNPATTTGYLNPAITIGRFV